MRLWLCLLLLCGVAGRAVADDDVEGGVLDAGPPVPWRVTIAYSESSHSVDSKNGVTIKNDWKHSLNGSYAVNVDSGSVQGPDYSVSLDTTSKKVTAQSGGGTSSADSSIDDGRTRRSGHSAGTLTSLQLGFRYHAKRKSYDANVTLHYRETGTDSSGKGATTSEASYAVNAGDIGASRLGTLTQTGKTFSIDYDTTEGKGDHHHEMHLHITLEPLRDSKYIAVLRPKTPSIYDDWMPKGPNIPGDDETKGGADLELVLQLLDKATNKPVPAHYTTVWSIESSKLPGWCMNYPKKSEANDHWDIYFDPKKNKGRHVQHDGEELVVGEIGGPQTVTVSSRDYGAHAVVSATVTIDGETLIARANGKGEPGIRVPRDDNQNHIADAWEKAHHVEGKDAAADDDETPAGMFNKGDGLDLFEEYRGFAVLDPAAVHDKVARGQSPTGIKPVFQQLDPHVKELFVILEGGPIELPAMLYGALRFGAIARITVFLVPAPELLEPMANDQDASHPRTLTTRVDPGDPDFGDPQAAVWISSSTQPWSDAAEAKKTADGHFTKIEKSQSTAYTPFVGTTEAAHHGSPTQVTGVYVFPSNTIVQIREWIAAIDGPKADPAFGARIDQLAKEHPDWHLTKSSVQEYANTHLQQLELELITFSTTHELGHAIGGRHHLIDDYMAGKLDQPHAYGGGDQRCPMRYWHFADPINVVLFLSGHWKLSDANAAGEDWKFCSEDWPDMRVWQKPEELDQRGKH